MTHEAQEAAAHWGGADHLRLIVERENAVYEADFPAGRAALRLHRLGYQTEAAIQSELWLCARLAEVGAPVPKALAAKDGAYLKALSSGRMASVIDWVEGPAMGLAGVPLSGTAAEQQALLYSLGQLLANFHAQLDELSLPSWFERPSWDVEGLVGEAPFWGKFWEHPHLTPPESQKMQATRAYLRDKLSVHLAEGGDFGLIHADVLRENVLCSAEGLRLIDFDDCGFGFRAYDLGTVLSQMLSEPLLPDLARALVDGYSALRPIDRGMVPAVTLARCCASAGWVMGRLSPDHPVHRSHLDRALKIVDDLVARGRVSWWEC